MQQAPNAGIPRCRRCGDVIGAYEPMVLLDGGRARRTSRAAESAPTHADAECFHEHCYAEAHADPPVAG